MDPLILEARSARKQAYAPYSNYSVGAAIRTKTGEVFTGSNIEFVNFSNTLHAEEVALGTAIQKGHREFDTIAVSTENGGTPCGMCRQSLAEFNYKEMIVLVDDGTEVTEYRLSELLPEVFTEENIREI